jgi:phage shock protein PspC (stress-responsive transcriptional regulator)
VGVVNGSRRRRMRPGSRRCFGQGKVVAGVCAGLAARYGWDPILVRLALVALVLCGFGSGILAYLAAWIVIPKAPLYFSAPPPPASVGPTQAVA